MHKISFLKIATIFGTLFILGCSSVTLRDTGKAKATSEPSYESSKPFFFWGLAGEHHVDVKQICKGSEPKQIQSQRTFTDSLLNVITLGIYSPRTVRVWCK